jgi:5-methylcytosine-specific restriction endonuclease McrA
MTDPFYKTKKWKHLRAAALRRDLYTCVVPGCGQPAYAVDHILARRAGGADALDNLRSLCKAHDHAVKETSTGARANGGKLVVKGFFADGTPRDPAHPWFTGGGGSNIKIAARQDRRPTSKNTY